MSIPDTVFTVIKESDCPFYNVGDDFRLSALALYPPKRKPVCTILARDIAGSSGASKDFGATNPGSNTIYCSGCGGTIGLAYRLEDNKIDPRHSDKTIDNIAAILSKFSMFKSLGKDDIRDIVSMIRLAQYDEGSIILKKGTPGKNLYIVLSGQVEVLGEDNRRIALLEKGEVFGEMSLLSGDPVGASIRVVETTKVLYLRSRNFRKVLNNYPPLQMYLARLLTKRLAQTTSSRLLETSAGISGSLAETPPPELCQTINMNQKTGVLLLNLNNGTAKISFRKGNIVKASYGSKEDKGAFFEILKASDGSFHFQPGLSPEESQYPEIGHFMCLLMEGVSRMDEELQKAG